MGRFMLDFAKADLKAAKIFLYDTDDLSLRISAYHTEQAIEKILKQVLEELGVSYKKDPGFGAMLAAIPDSQDMLSDTTLDVLSDNADRLRNWSTELRYTKSYVTTRRETTRMFEFACGFYNEVCEAIVRRTPEESDIPEKPTVDRVGIKLLRLTD